MNQLNRRCVMNKLARRLYQIEHTIECGISLTGTEVKSFKLSGANINEGYVVHKNGELFLRGVVIPTLSHASLKNHVPNAQRKLLAHKIEIVRIFSKISIKGRTGLPLSMYVNKKNLIKVEIGVGRGKSDFDKKIAIKERDSIREMEREIKYDL